jgi:hypothetical protein
MNDRTANLLIFLTFVGMVGLYIGLWMAYQKWQQYAPTIEKDVSAVQGASSGVTGLLTSLTSGS